jgi:hypothetical protein
VKVSSVEVKNSSAVQALTRGPDGQRDMASTQGVPFSSVKNNKNLIIFFITS